MNGAASVRSGEAAPLGGRPLLLSGPWRRSGATAPSPPPVVGYEFHQALDPAVERALVGFGGLNPFGQPYYRIVWGWQRGHWLGGEYRPKYTDRARHRERWHLEKWCPAESFGTPEQWFKSAMMDVGGVMVNVLGPYPKDGDYVRVVVFENYHTGEFVRPEVDMVVEAIVRNRQHAELSRVQIRKNIEADLEERRKAAEARMDEELDKREAAFALRTWMPVSGPMTPEYRRRDSWEPPRH